MQDPEIFHNRIKLAMIVLVISILVFGIYFVFFYPKQCEDHNCFTKSLRTCKKAQLLRSDDKASWLYEIKGKATGGICEVEVKLLELRQGEIDSAVLVGKTMTCSVNKLETNFPEKKIANCKGDLKEDLQDLLIKRMHDYLLTNVGQISDDFKEF